MHTTKLETVPKSKTPAAKSSSRKGETKSTPKKVSTGTVCNDAVTPRSGSQRKPHSTLPLKYRAPQQIGLRMMTMKMMIRSHPQKTMTRAIPLVVIVVAAAVVRIVL